MTDLHYLSATEALRLFERRELSPVELLDAVIARTEAVEPAINAFPFTYFERARAEARKAAARYAGRGDAPRPLEGIPIAIKDELPVKGEPWTMSSLIYRDQIADYTAPLVERVREAGGIIHARSATPEFSCAGFTQSRLNGVTRNPWNLDYGVGGSSGGAGAALAAGSTTLATGSDIGGSIRIPASFNGVVGFKPPYGRVPQEAPFNHDTYCHNGPMARTVMDCLVFENAIAGPHPDDIVSLRPKLVIPERLEGIEGLRIAYSIDLGGWAVDDEVAANTHAAAAAMREAGATVEEVDLLIEEPLLMKTVSGHFQMLFADWIGGEISRHRDLMTDHAIAFAEQTARMSEGITPIETFALESRLWKVLGALYETYDAIVIPTVTTRGLLAGDEYADHGLEVGGRQLEFYFSSCMTPLFNLASRCPVLSVPSGFARNGVPTGIQIAARTYDDVTAFRIGAAYERVRPWFHEPAARPTI
jgi:Asp-tRNA(Asn)/Glu-tRNA(Gln) amidotransferase A subunit family amidase